MTLSRIDYCNAVLKVAGARLTKYLTIYRKII